MLRSEEQRVRLDTDSGVAVDGIVQVRRVGFDFGFVKAALEHRAPVAVVVEPNGRNERIAVSDGSRTPTWLAWAAAPGVAILATRVLRSRRKKDS